jgi:hypothetical protein
MKIYVPLVYFELDGDDTEIADVVLHGYYNEADAKLVYPNAQILVIEDDFNPQVN